MNGSFHLRYCMIFYLNRHHNYHETKLTDIYEYDDAPNRNAFNKTIHKEMHGMHTCILCEMSDFIMFSNIMMSEKFMNNFLLTIWHKKVLKIGRTNNLLWKFWKGEGIDLGNGFFVTLTRGILAADLVKKGPWWVDEEEKIRPSPTWSHFFNFCRQDKGWCLAWGLTSRYYFGRH